MLALGCCNAQSHEVLLQELQPLTEEYMLERFKVPCISSTFLHASLSQEKTINHQRRPDSVSQGHDLVWGQWSTLSICFADGL